MITLQITVIDKVATYHKRGGSIVCGNSDYQIAFNFDAEWDAYPVKTARFVFDGRYIDKVFEGDTCEAPVLSNTDICAVGVFAGDLCTTTPALIPCIKSILCGTGVPADPPEDVYSQIMARLGPSGVEPAEGDIPKVFIDGAIPTTKDEVLAEIRYISKTDSFSAYLKIKCQGGSSMSYPKKNFTIKMYTDAARETKLKRAFKDWGDPYHKYVLKANYMDHSHARNIVGANLWSETVASRPDYDALPPELKNSPRNGAVDGFPVKVYTNGMYQGIYTWNISKDERMWGMDEDNPNHVVLQGCSNDNNFKSLWNGVSGNCWEVEVGTNSEEVKNSFNNMISCVKDTDDETFRQTIGAYLDIQSAIDYFIFVGVAGAYDNLGYNMLMATYDGIKWRLGAYDLDCSWSSDTKKLFDGYSVTDGLLWERIRTVFAPELRARYFALRKTVYSFSNIATKFERLMDSIGDDLYAEDLVIYPDINNLPTSFSFWEIPAIRDHIRNRLDYMDCEMVGYYLDGETGAHPLETGTVPTATGTTLNVYGGNHVYIDVAESTAVEVDISRVTSNPSRKNTDMVTGKSPLYSLKMGDVIWLAGHFEERQTTNGPMNIYLVGADSTLMLVQTIVNKNPFRNTIRVPADMDVYAIAIWNSSMSNYVIDFTFSMYVNGERYV